MNVRFFTLLVLVSIGIVGQSSAVSIPHQMQDRNPVGLRVKMLKKKQRRTAGKIARAVRRHQAKTSRREAAMPVATSFVRQVPAFVPAPVSPPEYDLPELPLAMTVVREQAPLVFTPSVEEVIEPVVTASAPSSNAMPVLVADHTTLHYGDIVKIGTFDRDYVVQSKKTIGRSGRVRAAGENNYYWKISSFGNKPVGQPVVLGDGIRFISVSSPSVNFVNYIYDTGADNAARGSALGVPVRYTTTLNYALLSKGEGTIRDKGWLQTYKTDYSGMSWSLKHGNGPRANRSARIRFDLVSSVLDS